MKFNLHDRVKVTVREAGKVITGVATIRGRYINGSGNEVYQVWHDDGYRMSVGADEIKQLWPSFNYSVSR